MFNGLLVSTFLIIVMLVVLKIKIKKSQLKTSFEALIILQLIWCMGLIAQVLFSERLNIPPIYFDYFVYVGICLVPVVLIYIALIFGDTKITFTKKYLLLFVIPIISLLVLWTNDYHHLFYEVYAITTAETVFGPYFNIHTIYSYGCLLTGIVMLLRFAMKNLGFFSKQSVLILIGTLIPIITNGLGVTGILPMSIYLTPITFAFMIILYAFAMFKFQFLNVVPIALQKVVDRISDGYIVIDEDMEIIDYNKTLIEMFKLDIDLRSKNINQFSGIFNFDNENSLELFKAIEITKQTIETVRLGKHLEKSDKYFEIEVNSIHSKRTYIGTLILFKDVTQHMKDLEEIKQKQDIIIRQEKFATLGELAGGIAHDLNQPLTVTQEELYSLKRRLQKEGVIGTDEDKTYSLECIANTERAIERIGKIINSIKNQIRNASGDVKKAFSIGKLLEGINLLMTNYLTERACKLVINADDNVKVYGEANELDRVITNIVKNSIEAYMAKRNYRGYKY